MIRYEEVDGTYYPIIFCDACDKPISNGDGNAYWLVAESDFAALPGIWFTHKQPCSGLDRILENRNPGTTCYSEELDRWLKHLAYNATHGVKGVQ